MKSKYVTGVGVPDYDDKITKAMKAAKFDGGGHDMVIAIENAEGLVYRLFVTIGLGEYMGAVDKLLKLGMTDKLANRPTSKEGYDSRFHF